LQINVLRGACSALNNAGRTTKKDNLLFRFLKWPYASGQVIYELRLQTQNSTALQPAFIPLPMPLAGANAQAASPNICVEIQYPRGKQSSRS
jgi:hypothetical protein